MDFIGFWCIWGEVLLFLPNVWYAKKGTEKSNLIKVVSLKSVQKQARYERSKLRRPREVFPDSHVRAFHYK